jgi:hypothetical protein
VTAVQPACLYPCVERAGASSTGRGKFFRPICCLTSAPGLARRRWVRTGAVANLVNNDDTVTIAMSALEKAGALHRT